MQHTPSEIKEKLLKAVDKEYNVLDMGTVVEVISILERTPITKEALEATRLGKYVNELRRKTTNESLAKRAKDLVRQWRHLIVPGEITSLSQVSTSNHQKNGLNIPNRLSETLGSGLLSHDSGLTSGLPSKNSSPILPSYSSSGSAIVVDPRVSCISPAVSLASSEKSSSPSLQVQQSSLVPRISTKKHTHSSCPSTPPLTHNFQMKTVHGHRPESPNLTQTQVTVILASDPVPKTHVANKRLRKGSPNSDDEFSKKIGQPNGVFVNSITDISRPVIDISGDCSRDSFGGNSDHGSVTWDICTPPKHEVPKDNGLKLSKTHGHKRVLVKGRKGKTSSGESSSLIVLPSVDDIVKEKIASIARIPKVKTTQELLAGLQAKTVSSSMPPDELFPSSTETKTSLANCVLPISRGSPSDVLEISRNKTEHIAKFLRSQSELELVPGESMPHYSPRHVKQCQASHLPGIGDALDSPDMSVVPRLSKEAVQSSSNLFDIFEPSISSKDSRSVVVMEDDCVDKTINEILSRLPPINYDSISWDEPKNDQTSSLSVSDLVSKLSTDSIDGVTGNFDHGKSSDSRDNFHEWHDSVSRSSYQGELLAILPYVVID